MKFKSTVSLESAVQLLKQGEVVGLPTETVYGLAGDIFNDSALEKIFATKARPHFDPLIVHIHQISQAKELVSEWSKLHEFLAQAFWPGPLTLIAQKNSKVSDLITSGLDTVALRWPAHPVFQQALALMKSPLAAPSANQFGKTSPTAAEHVMKEFIYEVAVVDGGVSEIGLESTVVFPQISQGQFLLEILRPGGITAEKLKETLLAFDEPVQILEAEKNNSPGHLKHHYQPAKPLYIFEGFSSKQDVLIAVDEKSDLPGSWFELKLHSEPLIAARGLYKEMRRLSELADCKAIYVIREKHQAADLWTAVWDRLEKASTQICNSVTTGF